MTDQWETSADKVNWDGLRADAVSSIVALEMAWRATEQDLHADDHAKMVRDLYGPALRVLAEFCACAKITEEPEAANDD